MFPLHDQIHQLVAVSGRFLSNRAVLKTLTGGTKRLGVFATPSAWRSSRVALTEGPFDALSLAHCQLPALALMGASWPEWLPKNLCGKQVIIATDADKAGDEAAEALKEMLTTIMQQWMRLRPPSGKDWNEMLMRAGRKAVCDALRDVWLPANKEKTQWTSFK